MLKAFEGLQYGFESPKSFQTSVVNHRITNLSLSLRSKLENFHTSGVNALDLDKVDERYLLSGGRDGALCIHDLQNSTGKAAYTAQTVGEIPRYSRFSHKFSVCTVQWYPFDTGMFLTSGMDNYLKMWDTNRLRPVEKFNLQMKIHNHHMSPVASQHSLIALALEYPHAVLLDPRSGSFCHELRAHKTALYCVRWSPICEHLLATGGLDSKILIWDIRSAKGYLSSLDQHNGEARGNQKDLITAHNGVVNSLCFTDDGLHLVSFGTDSKVRLWDVALSLNTLVNYGVIPNNYQRQQCTLEICCNTNPPLIFVPSSKRIYALDLFSGTQILTLLAHFRAVNCCAYRSSTNQLYSGGNDMNILFWTPDLEQETAEKAESRKSGARTTALADSEDAWSSSGSDNDT